MSSSLLRTHPLRTMIDQHARCPCHPSWQLLRPETASWLSICSSRKNPNFLEPAPSSPLLSSQICHQHTVLAALPSFPALLSIGLAAFRVQRQPSFLAPPNQGNGLSSSANPSRCDSNIRYKKYLQIIDLCLNQSCPRSCGFRGYCWWQSPGIPAVNPAKTFQNLSRTTDTMDSALL